MTESSRTNLFGWRRCLDACRSRSALIIGLLLCFGLLYFRVFTNVAEVELVAQTDEPSRFRIYWADDGQGYTPERQASTQFKAGEEQSYRFLLTDLGAVRSVRLDPTERRARVRIGRIVFSQAGYHPIRLEGQELSALRAIKGIASLQLTAAGLELVTAGRDAQLEVAVAPRARLPSSAELTRFLTLLALLGCLLLWQPRIGDQFAHVPMGLLLAIGLSLCMATLSKPNEHPDEHVHLAAGQYYERHWLPPKVCDPEIRDSYSVYGASRLDSGEIVYLLAGKFSRILENLLPSTLDSCQRLRLFNVGLLIALAAVALRWASYRPLLLPLLISPQIWYIFSYFNSDAFALFMALLCAGQVLHERSWLHRYWEGEQPRGGLLMTLALAVLLSLALLIKKNFFVVHAGLLLLVLLQATTWQADRRRRAVWQSAKLGALVVLLVGMNYAASVAVRGLDARDAIRRCREQTASDAYKPNASIERQHPMLHLRQRGTTWQDMFTQHRWGEKSFRSAFGVYGYLSISDSPATYRIVKTLLLLLLGYLLLMAFWRATPQGRAAAAICALLALALGVALFWHAWTRDMQAQGRYFLPAVGLIGILVQQQAARLNRLVLDSLTAALYVLACYSFLFIGLARIPKL
jgi:hypothetical protein